MCRSLQDHEFRSSLDSVQKDCWTIGDTESVHCLCAIAQDSATVQDVSFGEKDDKGTVGCQVRDAVWQIIKNNRLRGKVAEDFLSL